MTRPWTVAAGGIFLLVLPIALFFLDFKGIIAFFSFLSIVLLILSIWSLGNIAKEKLGGSLNYIGGWLGLIILGFWFTGWLILFPVFATFPPLFLNFQNTSVQDLLLAVFIFGSLGVAHIVIGTHLYQKKPSAVSWAVWFLIISFLLYIALPNESGMGATITELIKLFFAIAYFSMSRRVEAVYGKNFSFPWERQATKDLSDLLNDLKNDDIFIRSKAIDDLVLVGRENVPQFFEKLNDQNPNVRAGAVEILGRLKVSEAVCFLIPLLNDPEDVVKFQTAVALGSIGDPQAEGPLKQLFEEELNFDIKGVVGKAIEKVKILKKISSIEC